MNQTKQAKIDKFLQDEAMVEAVYEFIRNSFLKSKGQKDIQILAAERLSVDLLEEAWRGLERFRGEVEIEKDKLVQVGL